MEMWRKSELLNRFEVEAGFYKVTIGGTEFQCRNLAVIKRIGTSAKQYDAVLVLCNPGSCKPFEGTLIPEKNPINNDIPLVKVKSDETQHQIMRLMALAHWEKVCIINLSDLCAGNMSEFKNVLKEAENHGFKYHTIFSEERLCELKRVMDLCTGHVILGWGTDGAIKVLAKKALLHPLLRNFIGLKSKNPPFYYHPNPHSFEKKKGWIKDIAAMLG